MQLTRSKDLQEDVSKLQQAFRCDIYIMIFLSQLFVASHAPRKYYTRLQAQNPEISGDQKFDKKHSRHRSKMINAASQESR